MNEIKNTKCRGRSRACPPFVTAPVFMNILLACMDLFIWL
jgi:hypothetical protein